MEKLSLTLFHNILKRLPFVSLFNCKQVCKAWHALVTHPNFPSLHHAYHQSHNNPCLVLHSTRSHAADQLYLIDNFNYVDHNPRCNNGLVKEINLPLDHDHHKFTSVLHCDGFLCLSYMEVDDLCTYNKFCVYNLFTGELTELPRRPMTAEYRVVSGFGFHPESKEYWKVVKIVEHEFVRCDSKLRDCKLSAEQSIEVFTLGSSTWRMKENNPFRIRMQSSEVLVGGTLHWLGQDKVTPSQIIVSFDLMQEEFYQISLPDIRIDDEPDNSRLAVLEGCLSVVCRVEKNKVDVWLMKDYGTKESWTKEFTIDP